MFPRWSISPHILKVEEHSKEMGLFLLLYQVAALLGTFPLFLMRPIIFLLSSNPCILLAPWIFYQNFQSFAPNQWSTLLGSSSCFQLLQYPSTLNPLILKWISLCTLKMLFSIWVSLPPPLCLRYQFELTQWLGWTFPLILCEVSSSNRWAESHPIHTF